MDKSRRQGWRWKCRVCDLEATKRYYERHQERAIGSVRRWQIANSESVKRNDHIQNKRKKARRQAVVAAEKRQRGNRCEECGNRGELHWHHRDPASKVASISRMQSEGYSLAVLEAELEKCVLLCPTCHVEAHRQR